MLAFFNGLPNRVKTFLAVVLLGLVAVGFIQLDFAPENAQEATTTDVQIIVQTETGEPISDVEVHIIGDGAPTIAYTKTSGYVGVEVPERGDVDVQLIKDGYDTRYDTINLVADPERTRIFRLKKTQKETSTRRINYQHYTAQNDFLPLVLSILKPDLDIPIVKEIFSQSLGMDTIPFVYIGSPVSETVERFKRETGNTGKIDDYVEDIGFEYAFRHPDSGVSERGIIRRYKSDYEAQTIQVTQEDETEFKKYVDKLIRGEEDDFNTFYFAPILSRVQTDESYAPYTSFVKHDHLTGAINGYVFQYPKLGDLQDLTVKDELSESFKGSRNFEMDDLWMKKIIGANPENRGFLAFSYPYTVDSLTSSGTCGLLVQWKMSRHTPSPYLKFIDIENDTKSAFTIDSVSFKSLDLGKYDLTVADQRSSLFKNIPVKEHITNIVLEPGEHLIVPVEFGFSTDALKADAYKLQDIESSERGDIVDADGLYVAKPLPIKDVFSLPGFNMDDQGKTEYLMAKETFSRSFVDNSSLLNGLNDNLPDRLAVGSIIDVSAVSIDDETVSIASPGDDPSIYISNLLLGGSCPYLEVYDSISDNWFDLGTVLYSRNNKDLQKEEVHIIGSSNISKLRLEEREKEVTFLDSIEFTYIDARDEKEHSAFLPQPELKRADNEYMKLFEGDSLEIDLTDLIPSESYKIRLHINGYYEPIV